MPNFEVTLAHDSLEVAKNLCLWVTCEMIIRMPKWKGFFLNNSPRFPPLFAYLKPNFSFELTTGINAICLSPPGFLDRTDLGSHLFYQTTINVFSGGPTYWTAVARHFSLFHFFFSRLTEKRMAPEDEYLLFLKVCTLDSPLFRSWIRCLSVPNQGSGNLPSLHKKANQRHFTCHIKEGVNGTRVDDISFDCRAQCVFVHCPG